MAAFEALSSARFASGERQLSSPSSSGLRAGGAARVPRVGNAAGRVRVCAKLQAEKITLGAVAASALAPGAASASVKDLALELQEKLDAASAFGDEVSSKAEVVVKAAKGAAEASKPIVDAAAPYAKKAAGVAADAGGAVIESVTKAASEKLSGAGVDTDTVAQGSKSVIKAAGVAVDTATPVVKNVGGAVFDTLTATDASTLATEALVVLALAASSSVWAPILFKSLRGYAGSLSPPTALDILNTEDCILIDLRSPEEIRAKGSPSLPRGVMSKKIEVELAAIKDKKLRASMSNPAELEATSTAVIIAALKKVTRGTKLLMLDANGSLSTKVATKLASMGFGKVFVISGGFEGRGGWTQSSLSITEAMAAPTGGIFGTQRSS